MKKDYAWEKLLRSTEKLLNTNFLGERIAWDAQQQQSDALRKESCCSIQQWVTRRFVDRFNSIFRKDA